MDKKLDIIYEDDDIVAVNKPHNLATIPTKAHFDNNLGKQICQHYGENFVLRVINRLDKDTAGIVFVAKTLKGYNETKILSKEYFALCEGVFENKKFDITKPILTEVKDGKNLLRRKVSILGKPATTHCEVVEQFDNFALVRCVLETGRTHQIRVHLSSIDHPLLDDVLYNKNCKYYHDFDEDFSSHKKLDLDGLHTFLILKKASFVSSDGKIVDLEVDFPSDWNKYLKK